MISYKFMANYPIIVCDNKVTITCSDGKLRYVFIFYTFIVITFAYFFDTLENNILITYFTPKTD